jgi:hypothetical protein
LEPGQRVAVFLAAAIHKRKVLARHRRGADKHRHHQQTIVMRPGQNVRDFCPSNKVRSKKICRDQKHSHACLPQGCQDIRFPVIPSRETCVIPVANQPFPFQRPDEFLETI